MESASAETLTGPSVDATNEKDPLTVILKPLELKQTSGGLEVVLPPYSVSGVRIKGKY